MRAVLLICCALLHGALLTLAPDLAAQSPAPEEVTPQPADALIHEGVELRRAGKEREALQRFRRAYEMDPSPRARGQMGLAAKSLRRYVEAERYLREALAADGDPWIEQNRGALELAMRIVDRQLAWLEVVTDAPGAELFVNGSRVGSLPLEGPLRVAAGPIVVEVRAADRQPAITRAALLAGATKRLEVTLLPKEPEDTVAAPASPSPPPSPPTTAPMAADETVSFTPWIVTAAVTGAVGLTVGTALGIRTLQLKSERDDLCPDPRCDSSRGVALDEEARVMAHGATAGFVVAGLGAATALVLWLVEPTADPPAPLALDPTGTGLVMTF